MIIKYIFTSKSPQKTSQDTETPQLMCAKFHVQLVAAQKYIHIYLFDTIKTETFS
jgi:hypothetical protein